MMLVLAKTAARLLGDLLIRNDGFLVYSIGDLIVLYMLVNVILHIIVRCEEHTWRCSHFMDQEYPSIQILVAIAVGNRELKVDEKERREGRGEKRTA